MASVLLRMANVMKRFLHPSYVAVKELVASSTWKYTHFFHPELPTQTIMTEDDAEYKEIAGT